MHNTQTIRSALLALLAASLVILNAEALANVRSSSKVPAPSREGIVTANNGTTWSVRVPFQDGIGTAEEEEAAATAETYFRLEATSRTLPSLEKVDSAMVMVLMGVSGMVEAICLRYYNCFPNMMTGNTVKFLDALLDGRWHDSWWSASMVGLYLTGCTLYKAIEAKQQPMPSSKRIPRTIHRVVQATLLSFGLSDIVLWLFYTNESVHRWRLPLMALGFGMLNSLASQIWQTVTHALTGHYHKIGSNLVESVMGKQRKWPSLDKSSSGLLIFSLSMLVTSLFLRTFEQHSWFLQKRLLPPFGLTLGALYGTLLTGYSHYYTWISQLGRFHKPKAL